MLRSDSDLKCGACHFRFPFVSFFEQIVYVKPPWNLRDVLQCLKKHWAAVFSQLVPRRKLQTVLNLIDFFKSGMCFLNFTQSKYIFHTSKRSSYQGIFIFFFSSHTKFTTPGLAPFRICILVCGASRRKFFCKKKYILKKK